VFVYGKGRKEPSYFPKLKKLVDEYQLTSDPPNLDSCDLHSEIKTDMKALLELYYLVNKDRKKLEDGCKVALKLGLPVFILDSIVGNIVDVELLNKEMAEKKFSNYVALEDSDQGDCPICLYPFKVKESIIKKSLGKTHSLVYTILRTPCGHYFH